jgi:hypothetical protein
LSLHQIHADLFAPQFKEILEGALNYAEAPQYLPYGPDPGSNVSLLGITPEDVHANNPYKKVQLLSFICIHLLFSSSVYLFHFYNDFFK